MHEKDGTCYLCMKFDNNYLMLTPLHEHHVVFGNFGSGRQLSESYGLKVYLCLNHHLYGPDAVHRNKATKEFLCKEAQKVFEEHFPDLSFLEIFGINYLDDEDRVKSAKGQQDISGFIPINDGLEEMEW